MTEIAEAAGRVAMRYFKANPKVTFKADDSPVSEADLAVNMLLESELRSARPEYGWLSEESDDDSSRLKAERVYIIDPIDGTRAFISGQSAWGVALAVAEAGRITSAVFHMPAQNKTYAAHEGGGASLNGMKIGVSNNSKLDGAKVLLNKAALQPEYWQSVAPAVEPHFRPSLAYRICLVAEGRFDAAITFRRAWEWDIAAGDLICREAGGVVTTPSGAEPIYNSPTAKQDGLIASGPNLHSEIRSKASY